MYTFQDKNEQSISLRPEGTASVVRACIENNLLYDQAKKVFTLEACSENVHRKEEDYGNSTSSAWKH